MNKLNQYIIHPYDVASIKITERFVNNPILVALKTGKLYYCKEIKPTPQGRFVLFNVIIT